jgi:hypothetical protein
MAVSLQKSVLQKIEAVWNDAGVTNPRLQPTGFARPWRLGRKPSGQISGDESSYFSNSSLTNHFFPDGSVRVAIAPYQSNFKRFGQQKRPF